VIEHRIQLSITSSRQFYEVRDGALPVNQQQHHALASVEGKLINLL
jgi:hypothetical protein